jgi:hypothetical protein
MRRTAEPVLVKESIVGLLNGDEEIELSLAGMYLGDVDVEVADGVALEALFRRLVALDIRQAADAMALKASMQ